MLELCPCTSRFDILVEGWFRCFAELVLERTDSPNELGEKDPYRRPYVPAKGIGKRQHDDIKFCQALPGF